LVIGHSVLHKADARGCLFLGVESPKYIIGCKLLLMPTENVPALWLSHFPQPQADGHKYDRGVVLIAGGAEMTGATCLAARAAQRAGAGLVIVNAPAEATQVYKVALTSCIIHTLPWASDLMARPYQALLLGPGLGRAAAVREQVIQSLSTHIPCVLDADAISAFAAHRADLLGAIHEKTVLTPHAGEYARLFAYTGTPEQKAQQAAKGSGAVVVLKGHHTVIAAPSGETVVNTNAPPELATAGSGDVLAGLITGLLAQGMPPFMAACAGVWLHGAAANAFGPGLIAEDLNTMLPAVLRGLFVTKS
jgi:ADP-dependent NAD(P)H-hydrate dehydratase / NAD(P)H-hydrate epimerase